MLPMTLCGGNAVSWSSTLPMFRARMDAGVYVRPRTVTAGRSTAACAKSPTAIPRSAILTMATLLLLTWLLSLDFAQEQRTPDIHYVPTSNGVAEAMLKL